jgi:hypothetical protein
VHIPLLRPRWAKLAVLLAFTTSAFLAASAAHRLEVGLDQAVALPRDSYLQQYYRQLLCSLRVGPPLFFVVEGLDVSRDVDKVCSVSGCSPESMLSQVSRAELELGAGLGVGGGAAGDRARAACAMAGGVEGEAPGGALAMLAAAAAAGAGRRAAAPDVCTGSGAASTAPPPPPHASPTPPHPPKPGPWQVSQAARRPDETFIATGAASWLDDFLSWLSPALPKCCRCGGLLRRGPARQLQD